MASSTSQTKSGMQYVQLIILLLVCVAFIIICYNQYKSSQWVHKSSAITSGTVTNKSTQLDKNGVIYELSYTYEVPGNSPHYSANDKSVPIDTYNSSEVGSSISVMYDKDNLQLSYPQAGIIPTKDSSLIGLVVSTVIGVALLAFIVIKVIKR